MSEEEPQQPQTQPEDQQDPNISRVPYSQENLQNDHYLRHTDFQEKLHRDIDNALIYQSAKRPLHSIVDNYFSDNRILANLTDGNTRNDVLGTSLDLEKDMIFASSMRLDISVFNASLIASLFFFTGIIDIMNCM